MRTPDVPFDTFIDTLDWFALYVDVVPDPPVCRSSQYNGALSLIIFESNNVNGDAFLCLPNASYCASGNCCVTGNEDVTVMITAWLIANVPEMYSGFDGEPPRSSPTVPETTAEPEVATGCVVTAVTIDGEDC